MRARVAAPSALAMSWVLPKSVPSAVVGVVSPSRMSMVPLPATVISGATAFKQALKIALPPLATTRPVVDAVS